MTGTNSNTRDILADRFQATHPNVAWAIRQSPTMYPSSFPAQEAYQHLSQHTPDFLNSIEGGLSNLYDDNHTLRAQVTSLETQVTKLETRIAVLEPLNTGQANTIAFQTDTTTALKLLIDSDRNTTLTSPHKRKRQSTDPEKFSGKGAPPERQQEFETWITKIRGVFARDSDYFDSNQSQILYITDMLSGKAYDYIKDGIDKMLNNQDNTIHWQWTDRESLLEHLSSHYVILDTTQTSKNKLDNFPQGDRNYWSWKAELDEHMTRAKKTNEQKVDLLRKWISTKMKDLVEGLPEEIPNNAYDKWSKQMDTFAKNIANRAHQTSLEKRFLSLAPSQNNSQRLNQGSSVVDQAPMGEPMDLDRLSDRERQHRVENKLCLACGQSGHWKDAHDPTKTENPIPMPPRQPRQNHTQNPFDNNRGYNRGRGRYPDRGRGSPHNPNTQTYQTTPYIGGRRHITNPQWQLRVSDYERPMTSEELSPYTPTESDSISQPNMTQTPSRHQSPGPQQPKGRPLE